MDATPEGNTELDVKRRARSNLAPQEARRRYREIGALATLEQIRLDSGALDERAIAIGPFGRLDAAAVAARDGKTRGSITNLFGSQAAYQVETMDLALDAGTWVEEDHYPAPQDFATAESWVEAMFTHLSAVGPRHGADPELSYASLWVLWLGAVPYGLWSERVAAPSIEEYHRQVMQLENMFSAALAHFGLALRDGVTPGDLAAGALSLAEGVWLNQCLTTANPRCPGEPLSAMLVRSGRLLWQGAVVS